MEIETIRGEPPPRHTIEVDVSWLEPDPNEPAEPTREATKRARKKPPPLPGAAVVVPVLPAEVAAAPTKLPPKRNVTVEVDMRWVEIVDERKTGGKVRAVPRTAAPPPPPEAPAAAPTETKATKKIRPYRPIRREED